MRNASSSPSLSSTRSTASIPSAQFNFVFEILHADVEAKPFHALGCQIGAEPGLLEATLEVAHLPGVVEAREREAESGRAEPLQCAPDVLRTVDRHDGNALGIEVPTAAARERFERALIAHPFDEYHRAGSMPPTLPTS